MPSENERYNPPQVGDAKSDYETAKFSDLPTGELFWLNTIKSDDNHAHRKLSDTEALNIFLQEYVEFNRHQDVFYTM